MTMHVMVHPPAGPEPTPPSGDRWTEERPEPARPERRRFSVGVLAAVAGFTVILLVACCAGGILIFTGDDDASQGESPDPSTTSSSASTTSTSSSTTTSSSTSSSSSTSETTSETGSESPEESESEGSDDVAEESLPETSSPSHDDADESGEPSDSGTTASVNFPESFDGWTRNDSATSTSAIYRKDDYVLSAVAISGDQVDSYYERIWSDTSRHDDIVCGKLSTSANYQCAGAEDGSGVLVSGSAETAEETAQILAALLEEIGSP